MAPIRVSFPLCLIWGNICYILLQFLHGVSLLRKYQDISPQHEKRQFLLSSLMKSCHFPLIIFAEITILPVVLTFLRIYVLFNTLLLNYCIWTPSFTFILNDIVFHFRFFLCSQIARYFSSLHQTVSMKDV